eukprot:scaffold61949_cov66-Attheya_sp.AAC.4
MGMEMSAAQWQPNASATSAPPMLTNDLAGYNTEVLTVATGLANNLSLYPTLSDCFANMYDPHGGRKLRVSVPSSLVLKKLSAGQLANRISNAGDVELTIAACNAHASRRRHVATKPEFIYVDFANPWEENYHASTVPTLVGTTEQVPFLLWPRQ